MPNVINDSTVAVVIRRVGESGCTYDKDANLADTEKGGRETREFDKLVRGKGSSYSCRGPRRVC